MEEPRNEVATGRDSGGGGGGGGNRTEQQSQHETRRAGVLRALQLSVESGLLQDARSVREACLGLRDPRSRCEGERDGEIVDVAAPVHENIARAGEDSTPPACRGDPDPPSATRDSQRPPRALKVVFKPTRHPPSSYFKSRVAAAMATAEEAAEMAEAVAEAAEAAEAEEEAAVAAVAASAAASAAAANRQRGQSSLLGLVLASLREVFGAGRGRAPADRDEYYESEYENDGSYSYGHDEYEPFPSAFVC